MRNRSMSRNSWDPWDCHPASTNASTPSFRKFTGPSNSRTPSNTMTLYANLTSWLRVVSKPIPRVSMIEFTGSPPAESTIFAPRNESILKGIKFVWSDIWMKKLMVGFCFLEKRGIKTRYWIFTWDTSDFPLPPTDSSPPLASLITVQGKIKRLFWWKQIKTLTQYLKPTNSLTHGIEASS